MFFTFNWLNTVGCIMSLFWKTASSRLSVKADKANSWGFFLFIFYFGVACSSVSHWNIMLPLHWAAAESDFHIQNQNKSIYIYIFIKALSSINDSRVNMVGNRTDAAHLARITKRAFGDLSDQSCFFSASERASFVSDLCTCVGVNTNRPNVRQQFWAVKRSNGDLYLWFGAKMRHDVSRVEQITHTQADTHAHKHTKDCKPRSRLGYHRGLDPCCLTRR